MQLTMRQISPELIAMWSSSFNILDQPVLEKFINVLPSLKRITHQIVQLAVNIEPKEF